MRHTRARRPWLAGLIATLLTAFVPGVAHADAPAGDDFDHATEITALPFTSASDNAEATKADDDPEECLYWTNRTVWFRYTASSDANVRATVVSAQTVYPMMGVYTGQRGALTRVPAECAYGVNAPAVFHVTAGTTYYLAVGAYYNVGGPFTLRVEAVPPASNDAFAAAQPVPGLPTSTHGDLGLASPEPGEPVASCGPEATQSLWYAYTPTTSRWVSARTFWDAQTVTVYRGTALTDLTELTCQQQSAAAVFRAEAGQHYHVRVAGPPGARGVTLEMGAAPALTPGVSAYPAPATVFDDVRLDPYAGDQLGRPIASGRLDFGDGTSTSFTQGDQLRHRYTADGTYQLTITVTTDDGRTGTATTPLVVVTHDVAVSAFTAPARARADQTRPLSVSVTNTRHDERVEVSVYKRVAGGQVLVGTLAQWVPAVPGRVATFPFAYTFSAEDAAAGDVTFTAVARFPFPGADANDVDNTATATTAVR